MKKPVIICVDDEPQVLRSVVRDLRSRYGEDYRIVSSDSPYEALEILDDLNRKNQVVALMIVDQRMPELSGTELLRRALPKTPDSKRALLTAYADTNVAIQAINDLGLDYYLLKPWDPPEQNLYPVVDDLLDDWKSNYIAPFDGILVIDARWSASGHSLRDFMARNHVPYRWLDVENNVEAKQYIDETTELPLVIFPEGERLEKATIEHVVERLGISTRPPSDFYDLVIIGAGPAGLAAAVYASSEGVSTALIEQNAPGGQAGTSTRIENYLGFPSGLSGSDLARRASSQAERFGTEMILTRQVVKLSSDDNYHRVELDNGDQISCKSILVSVGVNYRRLNAEGIEQLEGVGVYYGAAATEAAMCKNQEVIIVGGGNSAGQAAVFLAEHASKVHIVVRGASLADSMSDYLVKRIHELPNVELWWHTQVRRVMGNGHLEQVVLEDTHDDMQHTIDAAALFIFIGAIPRTEWLQETLATDSQGYVLSGADLMQTDQLDNWPLERRPYLTETNVPGIFAAGDARYGSVKRVASAVGEGSITVQFVHQHLSDK